MWTSLGDCGSRGQRNFSQGCSHGAGETEAGVACVACAAGEDAEGAASVGVAGASAGAERDGAWTVVGVGVVEVVGGRGAVGVGVGAACAAGGGAGNALVGGGHVGVAAGTAVVGAAGAAVGIAASAAGAAFVEVAVSVVVGSESSGEWDAQCGHPPHGRTLYPSRMAASLKEEGGPYHLGSGTCCRTHSSCLRI
jgi:hypothetical protein